MSASPAASARSASTSAASTSPEDGTRSLTTTIRVPGAKLWTPSRPYLYPVKLTASVGGRTVSSYQLRTGIRTVRVGRRRPPAAQRQARAPARRRRARGVPGAGLRGRQRVPQPARLRGQGGGRDADAHALPAAPLHAGAGRQGGRPHLVGGPGLHAQHAEPLQARRDRARGQGGREEHRRQPDAPVGAAVVDRERALLAPPERADRLHQERRPPGEVARPEPARRPRRGRLPDGRLPAGLPRRST